MPRIWYDNNNKNVNKTPGKQRTEKTIRICVFLSIITNITHILSNRTSWANLSLLCLAIRYWQPTEAIEQKNHIFIPTGFEWAQMIRHIFLSHHPPTETDTDRHRHVYTEHCSICNTVCAYIVSGKMHVPIKESR